MDWGKPVDDTSSAFQNLISSVVGDLDDDYFEVKRQNDAIALNDIMRDLQEVLMSENTPQPDISMKYLFIDEFQDSDLSQIMVAALLVRSACTSVFTAIKSTPVTPQSTMRFRAFPPPPPQPTTLMEAAGRSSISISNTGKSPFCFALCSLFASRLYLASLTCGRCA